MTSHSFHFDAEDLLPCCERRQICKLPATKAREITAYELEHRSAPEFEHPSAPKMLFYSKGAKPPDLRSSQGAASGGVASLSNVCIANKLNPH